MGRWLHSVWLCLCDIWPGSTQTAHGCERRGWMVRCSGVTPHPHPPAMPLAAAHCFSCRGGGAGLTPPSVWYQGQPAPHLVHHCTNLRLMFKSAGEFMHTQACLLVKLTVFPMEVIWAAIKLADHFHKHWNNLFAPLCISPTGSGWEWWVSLSGEEGDQKTSGYSLYLPPVN